MSLRKMFNFFRPYFVARRFCPLNRTGNRNAGSATKLENEKETVIEVGSEMLSLVGMQQSDAEKQSEVGKFEFFLVFF